jgi:HEAT repeats
VTSPRTGQPLEHANTGQELVADKGKNRSMSNNNVLDSIVRRAKALQRRPGHEFRDFERLCRELSRSETSSLLTLMAERAATVVNAEGLTEAFVYLWRDGELNIQVKVLGSEAATDELSANEFDLVLMNISPHDVEVPAHRAAIDTSDLTRRPTALVHKEPLLLASHVPVFIPAYKDLLDLRTVATSVTVLVIHSAARGRVTWVFDRATGQAKHLTSTNLQGSRMQLAARLLGAMGSKQDAPVLEALALSDEAAFIRWEAAEALYRLDPDAAAALLRDRLIGDRDRDIRKAATTTLSRLR